MPEPRQSKNERRDEARAAALRLKQEQQKAAARKRTLAIGALVVGIAVVGVLVAVILGQGGGGSDEQVQPTSSSDRGAVVVDVDGVVTPPEDQVDPGPDGEEGTDDDLVWPNGAFGDDVVVVSVYSDFMCPFCGLFETTAGPVLDELRLAGEVVVAYHPVSILDRFAQGSEFSTRATAATFAVAEDAPDAFVGFVAELFANQPEENTAGLSDDEIAEIARTAGVPDDVAATLADGTYRWWAAEATDRASQDLGSLSTPTILLNGVTLDPTVVDWREPGALEAAIEEARG